MNSVAAHIKDLHQAFRSCALASPAGNSQYFFKEPIQTHGVKTPAVNEIAKEKIRELKKTGWNKKQFFELAEQLWKTGYIEGASVAAALSYAQHKSFDRSDFPLFEKWIGRYINNWASCDKFCNHTIGSFLKMYPDFLSRTLSWTTSSNRWMRRAAAVSLIVPGKQGLFIDHILLVAGALLHDADDLVQKGYGWMLKEAAVQHEEAIFSFILTHKATMPRTALRYAVEKMPAPLRKEAMEK